MLATWELHSGKPGVDRGRWGCNLRRVIWNLRPSQTRREGNRATERALAMDIVVAVIMVGVAALFVYAALDATKHPQ